MGAVLGLAILGVAGCHKQQTPQDSLVANGVSVSMPRLQQTFASSTNDQVRKLLFDADQGFRYGDYPKAAAAVEQLSTNPDVTEDQKKVASEVLEQLKKLAGATSPPAPAAQ